MAKRAHSRVEGKDCVRGGNLGEGKRDFTLLWGYKGKG